MKLTMKPLFLILLMVSLILTACQSKADFDIRGTWEYTMTDTNQNTYDEGTITFEGKAHEGTYLQFNIYDVDYDGTYTVRGAKLSLDGDESWQAELTSADRITGTWEHADEGFSGTFEAVRFP